MDALLEISDLVKYYHSGVRGVLVKALSGVSFKIKRGEVFGLLGPNGAGKSTTIKIVLGLLKANSGTCKIFGRDVCAQTKKRIGYLPEAPNFYKFLTARELVEFYARICGLSKKEAKKSAQQTLEIVGLKDALDRRLGEYSKGMLQRAGLASAIVHNPEFVILDEPASGLDPVGIRDMGQMVLNLKSAGKTVLLCSHMLSQVENLCDSVAILQGGKVAVSGNLNELLTLPNLSEITIENLSADFCEKIAQESAKFGAKFEGVKSAKISLESFFENAVRGGRK